MWRQLRYNIEKGLKGKREGGADGHTAQMRRAPARLLTFTIPQSKGVR